MQKQGVNCKKCKTSTLEEYLNDDGRCKYCLTEKEIITENFKIIQGAMSSIEAKSKGINVGGLTNKEIIVPDKTDVDPKIYVLFTNIKKNLNKIYEKI